MTTHHHPLSAGDIDVVESIDRIFARHAMPKKPLVSLDPEWHDDFQAFKAWFKYALIIMHEVQTGGVGVARPAPLAPPNVFGYVQWRREDLADLLINEHLSKIPWDATGAEAVAHHYLGELLRERCLAEKRHQWQEMYWSLSQHVRKCVHCGAVEGVAS